MTVRHHLTINGLGSGRLSQCNVTEYLCSTPSWYLLRGALRNGAYWAVLVIIEPKSFCPSCLCAIIQPSGCSLSISETELLNFLFRGRSWVRVRLVLS